MENRFSEVIFVAKRRLKIQPLELVLSALLILVRDYILVSDTSVHFLFQTGIFLENYGHLNVPDGGLEMDSLLKGRCINLL
ncbi:MAG: hypothetical protein CSA33_06390 [Desulfobulbus propionicus]|nr:MAG: hypothetical protein CSA33_06390 [Desulfobulbus propionicus]